MRRRDHLWRKCAECKEPFKAWRTDAMTCSTICRGRLWRKTHLAKKKAEA